MEVLSSGCSPSITGEVKGKSWTQELRPGELELGGAPLTRHGPWRCRQQVFCVDSGLWGRLVEGADHRQVEPVLFPFRFPTRELPSLNPKPSHTQVHLIVLSAPCLWEFMVSL